MITSEVRNIYFEKTIEKLKSSNLIEGIVQIGSGVIGFSDELSDIDLMVAAPRVEDAIVTKNTVYQFLKEFDPIYIKEKQFSDVIFLLIVILENKLEFNVSIVPRELLSVKSPLWKVILDKTGLITKKMNSEQEKFENKQVKYDIGIDLPFEFVYCTIGLDKALRRNNLIYAMGLLETMRTYILYLQAMNENKKLHQFKAYDTLETTFVNEYLKTYPESITLRNLKDSSEKLKVLFEKVLNKSSIFTMETALKRLLKIH